MARYTAEEAIGLICNEFDSGGELDIEEELNFPLPDPYDDDEMEMPSPSLSPSPPLSPSPAASLSPPPSPFLLVRSRSVLQVVAERAEDAAGGEGVVKAEVEEAGGEGV